MRKLFNRISKGADEKSLYADFVGTGMDIMRDFYQSDAGI